MFVHNINPVLLNIGPLEIRWYGLVYVFAFVAFYFALKKFLNYSSKEADSLTFWSIIGLIIGARLFYFIFYRPDLFSIVNFFRIWEGGMSFHGALLGLLLACYFWTKKHKQNFWKLADVGAIVASVFLFLGRIANFINSEIVGTRFSGAWCVEFPTAEGCRHPVQLYAALKNVFIGVVIYGLYRTKKFSEGFVFWMFALLYGVLRFLVNFLRDDPALFSWVKMGHVLSFALIIAAVVVLIKVHKSDLGKLFKRGK